MDKEYPITAGKEVVGNAGWKRDGLYYHVVCNCKPLGDGVYQVLVSCGSREENLGVCVPRGSGFGLDTRIPIKRIGEGTPSFRIVPKYQIKTGDFVPVTAGEPFSRISDLENGWLEKRDGKTGIGFR